MSTSTEPDLIETGETARVLSVHRSTIPRLVGRGVLIPARKLHGSRGPYLFEREHVQAVAASRAKRR